MTPPDPLPRYDERGGIDTPIVNVAQVPQRTLFRYPGGKTWFVPYARRWLLWARPARLVEPFAGGGIVGLTAAFEGLADEVILVERDEDVAAVWHATLHAQDAEALACRIEAFALTPQAVDDELSADARSTVQRAFHTILRNRVNRGGILAPGAGRIKAGEGGRGMASRWYPATLARRLRAIAALPQGRLRFIEGDALEVMKTFADDASSAFFVDPPYTAGGKNAGNRLYRHHALDHAALFAACAAVKGDVAMTYDDAEEVRALARRYGLTAATVPMKSTHHARQRELVVGKNLGWLA